MGRRHAPPRGSSLAGVGRASTPAAGLQTRLDELRSPPQAKAYATKPCKKASQSFEAGGLRGRLQAASLPHQKANLQQRDASPASYS